MRAGKLDRLILVERADEQKDEAGAVALAWSELYSLKAQLIESTTADFIRNFGSETETAVVFRTWYPTFDQPTVADRIVYSGQIYEIKQVKELGRRQGLEIRAVAKGLRECDE